MGTAQSWVRVFSEQCQEEADEAKRHSCQKYGLKHYPYFQGSQFKHIRARTLQGPVSEPRSTTGQATQTDGASPEPHMPAFCLPELATGTIPRKSLLWLWLHLAVVMSLCLHIPAPPTPPSSRVTRLCLQLCDL